MALTDSLISHWDLDEASGTRADSHGSSGLAENGTVGNAAGKVGNAAAVSGGAANYLSVADSAPLSTGDIDFTVQAWIYITTGSDYAVAGKWSGEGQYEWLLYYSQSATTCVFAVTGDGAAASLASVTANNGGSLSDNTWYLFHAWHDAANNQLGISVNAGTPDTAAHSAGVFDSTSNFTVGRSDDGPSMPFNGRIDELAFWKRVLTGAERTELYNSGAGLAYSSWSTGPSSTIPPLMASYRRRRVL